MQRGLLGALVACLTGICVLAQDSSTEPTPIQVSGAKPSERLTGTQQVVGLGPHWQTVQRLVPVQGEQGDSSYLTNSYVQLETGLAYQDETGKWTPSSEEIEIAKDGAIAWKGQHKVSFAGNLNAEDAIQLRLPDGQMLVSHVYGLAYYDAATGQSVLIAGIKDSQAWLQPPNQLVYADAFDGVGADVRYTYTKAGFEQDIILREAPPSPEKYGLNPATTRIEVWTEFVQAPEPQRAAKILNPNAAKAADQLTDEAVDFGSMQMGTGKTFVVGGEEDSLAVVAKQWMPMEGRRFLVETVAVGDVAAALERLPARKGGASLRKPAANRLQALQVLPTPARRKARDQAQAARRMSGEKQLAMNARAGLVLDYSVVASASNFTFRYDTTYYVSGPVNLTGTTTFDGGTVIKYANTGSPSVNISGSLVWRGEMYRPVIMTAKDDNTVGEAISGSSGTPSGYYASRALNLTGTATTTMTLSHFRISYAQTAIGANSFTGASYPLLLRHGQIVNCQTAYTFGYGTSSAANYRIQNNLVYNVNRVFESLYGVWVQGDNLTVDLASALNYAPSSSTVTLNNSLVTAVTTSTGSVNTATTILASSAGVYATAGGGKHYLAGNTYRNTATAGIDSALSADLRRMTTYAPGSLGSSISVTTKLRPTVSPDTDTLDQGYHYPPLDFVTSTLTVTKGTLILSDGVAFGYHGSAAVWLQAGAKLTSKGLPERMNVLVRYTSVQETPVTGAPAYAPNWVAVSPAGSAAAPPSIDCRFTAFYADQGNYHFYAGGTTTGSFPVKSISLSDCQVYGGRVSLFSTDAQVLPLTLKNNLWMESYTYLDTSVTISAFNQLWWHSPLDIFFGANGSEIRNCIFDNSPVDGSTTTIVSSHNGYIPASATKIPGTLGSDVTAASLSYTSVSGGLGAWYQSGTTFLNAGSQSASLAGLAEHTVQSSQAKDTGSVDLGFHYLAVNTSTRTPLDSDGDGLADYVEDADGDGLLDTGETDIAVADTDHDGRTDQEELNEGTDPRNALSAKHILLTRWLFDSPNYWTANGGQVPLVESYVGNATARTVTGFSGQAASFVLGTDPATTITSRLLTYKWVETSSKPNLTFAAGSVRFWFKPSWASASAGGSGPGAEARLLNVGIPVTTTSGNGWWAVYVEANGNQVTFGTQAPANATQNKLSADISWKLNEWHFVEVAYNNLGTTIYVDGQVAKTGSPPAAAPNATALATGVAVGMALDGSLSAKGRLDRLETYNYAQLEQEAYAEYRAVSSVDTDGDLLSDVLENQLGTNPTSADSDTDGMPDGWEYRYGFNPLSPLPVNTDHEADSDADSDGVTNKNEYLAGTDPRNNEAAIRAPLLPVIDPYDRALDQKHLVNIDLGQLKTVSGTKAAGVSTGDQWNVVLGGSDSVGPTYNAPSLLSEAKLKFADGTASPVRIWSGYGPVFGLYYWGVNPATGTACWVDVAISCRSTTKTGEELLQCIYTSQWDNLQQCLGLWLSKPVFSSPQNRVSDPLGYTMPNWPSFSHTVGFFLAGIDKTPLFGGPNIGTIDDLLEERVDTAQLKLLANRGIDTTGASTRTVIYGLSPEKAYRLYIKGVFGNVQASADELLNPDNPVDPNVRYVGEVAGASRYLIRPSMGAATILNNLNLAYVQVVQLDPLPAPAIIVQSTPTVKPLAGYGMCRLEWAGIPTAESYAVFRREGTTGEFTQVATSTALGHVDGGLKDGTTYQYQVEARNEAFTSPRSATVSVTTPGTNPNSRNHAPSLQRPEAIQFAERNSTFRLSVPRLLAETKAVDIDGDAISFRIDSVPSGQTVKLNSVAISTFPATVKPGDIIEWTAPNTTSEQGIIAFYVSAFDGFLTSVYSVPVAIAVKPPSALYGWGYSGVGNLAQGKGLSKIDIWSWYNPDKAAAYRNANHYANLHFGRTPAEMDLPLTTEDWLEATANPYIVGSVTTEPVVLGQVVAGVKTPLRGVSKISGGQRFPQNYPSIVYEFGMNNALLDNNGRTFVWGLDLRTGMFGEGQMEQYTGVERPFIVQAPDISDSRQILHDYVYDAVIPFELNSGGTLKQWDSLADVSVSYQHGLGVDYSGSVYSWGADAGGVYEVYGYLAKMYSIGYLGLRGASDDYLAGTDDLGDVKVAHTPQKVRGLDNVIQVIADDVTSIALRQDGTVWYWGNLTYDNNNSSTAPPEKVTPKRLHFNGLSDANAPRIRQIAGSRYHFVALAENGEVWEFGYVPRLAIGSGQYASAYQQDAYRDTAEKVPGLLNVKKIAAGGDYALALLKDGSVMEWGQLYWLSSQYDRHWSTASPVPVQGISQVRDIAVSTGRRGHLGSGPDLSGFALACDQQGRVWTWGVNEYGELGMDDRAAILDHPRQVSGLSDASSVFAGQYNAYAVARYEATTPVSLKAVAGNQQVSLTWQPYFGAVDYVIERTTDPTGSFVQMGTSLDNKFTDLTVVNGQTYWYQVKARVDNGSSVITTGPSSAVRALPNSPPALGPTGVTVIPECRAIEVRWDPVPLATGYRIYRTGGGISGQMLVGEADPLSLHYVDQTVQSGNNYSYSVAALNSGGMGPVSNPTTPSISPDVAACPPVPPSMTTQITSTGTVLISWQAPDISAVNSHFSGADVTISHYVVRWQYSESRAKNGSRFSRISDVDASTLSYDHAGLYPGEAAYYTVSVVLKIQEAGRAYYVESDNAPPIEVIMSGPSAGGAIAGLTGTGLSVQPYGESAKVAAYLTWNDDANSIYYEVQRSTVNNNFTGLPIRQEDHRYLDTAVTAGTTYYYRVRGVGGSAGSWSAQVSVVPPTAGATAVPKIGLQAYAYDGKALLLWPPQPLPAMQYPGSIRFIVARMLPTAPGYRAITDDPPAYGLTLTDDTVLNGTAYSYRILAFDSAGSLLSWSDPSSPVTPSASASLNLSAVPGNGYVSLVWNSLNASAYKVSYATESGGRLKQVATVREGSSYIHKGLKNGQTLYYQVTAAVDGVGDMQTSGEVAATPLGTLAPLPPDHVTLAFARPLTSPDLYVRSVLTWRGSDGATGYQVQRAIGLTDSGGNPAVPAESAWGTVTPGSGSYWSAEGGFREDVALGTFAGKEVWYRIRSVGASPVPGTAPLSDWLLVHETFVAPADLTLATDAVVLISPAAGSVTTPTNLVLSASTKLFDITQMEYYDGDNLIGVAKESPWQFVWNNVPSGSKTLRAYAAQANGNGEYSLPVTVNVQWATPLNDYQTSATDLTVPATGLSLSLERSYNSGRYGEQGVLGKGWQTSWDRAKLVIANGGSLATGWAPGAGTSLAGFPIIESVPHQVTITLPGGEEVIFSAELNNPYNVNPLTGEFLELRFNDLAGSGGTLTCPVMKGLAVGSACENCDWLQVGDLTMMLTNPLDSTDDGEPFLTHTYDFTYTSAEGIAYVFHNNPQSGDTWKLVSMTDRNGHALTFVYETTAPFRLTGIRHDAALALATARNLAFAYSTSPSGTEETISVYDPIEAVKPVSDTTKFPTMEYVVTLGSGGSRLLKEVHQMSQRRGSSANERYEAVRYTYGTTGADQDRLTKIEAGLQRYGTAPGTGEVLNAAAITSWLQVLLNGYTGGKLTSQTDARGTASMLDNPPGTHDLSAKTTMYDSVTGTTGTVEDKVSTDSSGAASDVFKAGISVATHFEYDEKGRVVTETSPLGKTKTYHYDSQDRLTGITDENGNGGTTVFNPDGSVYATQDANGHGSSFSYDGNGNLERSVDAAGTTTVRVYYSQAKWAGLVQRESRYVPGIAKPLVTDYEYTDEGDLLREVNYIDQVDAPAVGASRTGFNYSETEYPSYDGNGNRLTEKTWRTVSGSRVAATTTYTYDAQNRTLTTRDPLYVSGTLRESASKYDGFGRVTNVVDLLGRVTVTYYDANGNLVQTIYPDGTLTRTVYDERNRPRFSQDRLVPQAPTTLADCQALGTTSKTTGPGTETLYDTAGRTVGTRRWASFTVQKAPTASPATGQVTCTLTDASGNALTAVSGSPVSMTRTAYDAAGRVQYSVNASRAVVESVYDDAGRLIKTLAYTAYLGPANFTGPIAPSPTTDAHLDTTFGYDDSGNQIWMLDAKSQALAGANGPDTAVHQSLRTDYRYDEANRRTLIRFPLVSGDLNRKYRQTVYDGLGRRLLEFDEAAVATAYGYDNLGRLTAVTNDFQLGVNPTLFASYAYDEVGGMTKQTDALGRETKFEYDALGRRTKRTLPDNAFETVTYSDVLDSGSIYVDQRQIVEFNGRRVTLKNDQMGRLALKKLETPSPWTAEATLDFYYSPEGWLKKVREVRTGASTRYTFYDYDAYGRLAKRDSPEGILAYQYLATGSLDTIRGYPRGTVAQPTTPDTAANALALPGGAIPDISLKYEYDLLGRLQKVSDLDGASASFGSDTPKTLYSYDENGNLDSVRYPDSGGKRMEHKYVYTQQNRLKQLDLRQVNSSSGSVVGTTISYQYWLDANGRRSTVIEDDQHSGINPRALRYTYDVGTDPMTGDPVQLSQLNRLSREVVTSYNTGTKVFDLDYGDANYQYDQVGNRVHMDSGLTSPAIELNPKYDKRDRLTTDPNPSNPNSNYDANGNTLNLRQVTLGDPNFNETPNTVSGNVPAGDTYDSENRLTRRVFREEISGDSTNYRQTTLDLTYDHAGNRVAKVRTVEVRNRSTYALVGSPAVTRTTYLVDDLNPTGYAQVLAEYQSQGQPAPGTPATGLQGYWKFEDLNGLSAPDSSGSGFTATFSPSVSIVGSPVVRGVKLNGSSESGSVSDNTALRLGSAMTLTCWLRKDGEPTLESRVLGKGTASTLNYSLSEDAGASKRLLFKFRNTGGTTYSLTSTKDLEVGQWYHVACTYDGSSMKLYLNGELCGSLAATGTPTTGTDALTFGYLSGGAYFNGALDEIRVFNVVLSAAQILDTAGLALSRSYAYGHDLISQRLGDRTQRDHYGYDGLGSVRHLFKVDGSAVLTGTLPAGYPSDYTYDAYGRLLASREDPATAPRNLYRYAGEQWDPDLGMSYNRARYLNPATGSFWTMDSYEGDSEDPISLHKYLYAGANPVNGTDPSGHFTLSEINVSQMVQSTLNAIRSSAPARAYQFAERAIDVANTFRDIVSLFQGSSVLRTYLADLRSQASISAISYDLRKLIAMTDDHILGISGRIVADFPQIVGKIRKNHPALVKEALRSPKKATLVIGLPSLPGTFFGSSQVRPVPALAVRVGPFKVKFAIPIGGTGGSLFSLGLEAGGKKGQLFRIDYHGRRKGNEPDGVYFQVGPKILGESFEPWFHYHTPNY